VLGDIETWNPEPAVDLIFSNAAFHWVAGHATLFRGMINGVAPSGALAVQMPNNFHSPAHSVMREAALSGDPRWAKAMVAVPNTLTVHPPAFYYDVLRKHASRVDIWETEYQQVMDGPRAVFDWIRSTSMRPYLDRLPDVEQRQLFEELCLEGIQEAYRPNDQGKVLFPYRRMFIVAYR
jgi:trans-aconitate 2-methyltransferase